MYGSRCVCTPAECVWLWAVHTEVQGLERVGMSVKSQLGYTSASKSECSQQFTPGESGYPAPIQYHQLKNEWAGDRAGGFNERPMPGMYVQVYLVKHSDLFF